MLITVNQLEAFTGVYKDEESAERELEIMFIKSAQAKVINYLGYNPEEDETLSEYALAEIQNVCLEISALICLESNNNLGVSTASDIGGQGRTFLNVVDYSKYLDRLSSYRKNTGM